MRVRGHWFWGVLLSVTLTFFSFPPHPLGILMPVALVPLFLAAQSAKDWKGAFFRTWLYCFIGNIAICIWVGYTLEEFSHLPMWLSYPCVFLLSVFEQSSMALAFAARKKVWDHFGRVPPFFTPCLWLALDSVWPKFFPNTLGNSLYSVPILVQGADLFGVWGLTFFLVCSNELISDWISERNSRANGIANAIFIGLFILYAGIRSHQIKQIQAHPKSFLRVALIQPNVTPKTKTKAQSEDFSLKVGLVEQLLSLSKSALASKPDLIFWPETAFPSYYHSDMGPEFLPLTEQVDDFVQRTKIPLLLGALDFREFRSYNGLHLAISGSQTVEVQHYQKHILLPVGEYLPFSDWFPRLNRLSLPGKRFSPGPGPRSLRLGELRLGALICYEGLFPSYVRRVAEQSDILVNATNDAWYGPGMEPYLHLQLTAMRSIELRMPLIRSTNTGVSAWIDIDGRVKQATDLFVPAIVNTKVPVYPSVWTPYRFWGNSPLFLGLLWCCLALVVYHKRNIQPRSPTIL